MLRTFLSSYLVPDCDRSGLRVGPAPVLRSSAQGGLASYFATKLPRPPRRISAEVGVASPLRGATAGGASSPSKPAAATRPAHLRNPFPSGAERRGPAGDRSRAIHNGSVEPRWVKDGRPAPARCLRSAGRVRRTRVTQCHHVTYVAWRAGAAVQALSTLAPCSLHDLSTISPRPLHDLSTTSPRPLHDLSTTSPRPLHDLSTISPQANGRHFDPVWPYRGPRTTSAASPPAFRQTNRFAPGRASLVDWICPRFSPHPQVMTPGRRLR
jgi:hypothetical protein